MNTNEELFWYAVAQRAHDTDQRRLRDDRETIGELAGAVVTLQEEMAELRDELHELAVTFRRHQRRAIMADIRGDILGV